MAATRGRSCSSCAASPGSSRAVVGDLQRLHLGEPQRARHVGLRVGGQQEVEAAAAEVRDDRAIVGIALGRRRRPGRAGGHSTRMRQRPDPHDVAGVRGHDPRSGGSRRGRQRALDRGRPARSAVDDESRPEALQNRQGRALVVELGVREHQGIEPADALLAQPEVDSPLRRSGVDQHRGAVALHQRRVPLADVEERDHQLAGPRREPISPRPHHGEQRDERGRPGDRRDGRPARRGVHRLRRQSPRIASALTASSA